MATVQIRPGLLDRLKANSHIADDEAFARAIGVSRATLSRVKAGESPSIAFIAGVANAFGLGLGEVAVIASDEPTTGDAA